MAWPEPSFPVGKMSRPIAARRGRQRSMSAAVPPAMIASVPSTARLTPPETGASTRATPRAASSAPSSRVPTGADELMSMTSEPAARPARTPSLLPAVPHSTFRTVLPSGSMVTTSALARPSAASEAGRAARAAKPARRAGSASPSTSSNPAFSRFSAIGAPILPSPTKPMRGLAVMADIPLYRAPTIGPAPCVLRDSRFAASSGCGGFANAIDSLPHPEERRQARLEGRRTVLPAMFATSSPRLFLRLVDLVEDLLGGTEGIDGGGNAAIDAGLEEDLGDLLAGDAVVERALDVQPDLVRPVQGGQHGEVQHRARLAWQARARPHAAPAIFGDEILQRLVEGGGIGDRFVDVLGAEHLAPHRQAFVIKRLVHGFLL